MKKFKSFVYVLALALIFVGAASVTKASAEDTGYTVTISATGATATATYDVDGTPTTITAETKVPAGETVTVTFSPSDDNDKVTVSARGADDSSVTVNLANDKLEGTFTMPASNVTVTVEGSKTDVPTETPTPTPTVSNKITKDKVTVRYYNETIDVESNVQVYYQIVKTESTTSNLKPANWIKAAKYDSDEYWIDFSGTANSKDVFFALTTDSTKGDADVVATVDAAIKSMKAVLNYKTEEFDGGLADVISTLDVKGVDADYTTKEGLAANDADHAKELLTAEATKDAKVFSLQWKRGVNGEWQGATAFDPVHWNMLKASNGTLYIAADGLYELSNDQVQNVTFRMSKEAKVKIPKSAKAPTIKVDYVKGTLAVKNGMQIRLDNSGVWTKWMDVIAYKKGGTDNGIFALAEKNLETSVKASKVTVADFVAAINDEEILNFGAADGAKIKLEVRTAATVKKFPSMTGIMELVLPAAAPTVAEGEQALSYTKADKATNTAAAYEVDFSKLFTKADGKNYTDYEYVLVAKADDGVNLEKQKWTKLTGDKVDWAKNIGKNFTYYKEGSTEKATVAYENIAAIYIRLAAVKAASKDTVGVFASDYATIVVKPAEKKVEVTPTPGEEEPEVTPTPGEEEPEVTPTPGEEEPEVTAYKITWETVENCTVAVTYGTEGTAVTSGTTEIAKGETVTVTLTAADGYTATVAGTYGEGTELTITEGKFTMPEGAVTLTITVTADNAGA